ncbi:MAG: hypothetical protein AAGN66_28985 [Acidobacteriota bacterium]
MTCFKRSVVVVAILLMTAPVVSAEPAFGLQNWWEAFKEEVVESLTALWSGSGEEIGGYPEPSGDSQPGPDNNELGGYPEPNGDDPPNPDDELGGYPEPHGGG